MSCVKSLNLHVWNLPPPTYYWPMWVLTGNTPDIVDGNNLAVGTGAPVLGPGKISGAIVLDNPGFPIMDLLRTGTWSLSTTPRFTFRFWTKSTAPVPGSGIGMTDVIHHNHPINSLFWQMSYNGSYDLGVQTPDSPISELGDTDPVDTLWHRIVSMWDADTLTMYYKLDNRPTVSLVVPTGGNVGAGVLSVRGLGLPVSRGSLSICELAFWDSMLDASQLTEDWNSGNGCTWHDDTWNDS